MESTGEGPRSRRSFTPEFKAEIVELCAAGDRSVAVREWVRPGYVEPEGHIAKTDPHRALCVPRISSMALTSRVALPAVRP